MVISAAAFIAAALLVLGLTMKSEQVIMRERIRTQTAPVGGSVEQETALPFVQRVVMPHLRKLATLSDRFTSHGAILGAEERLETAGRPHNLGAREFLGLKVLSVVAFTVLGLLTARLLSGSVLLRLGVLVLSLFIGVIMPDYLLTRTINERQAKLRRALPDTLDLLTVSVEAGLGLDAAMQKVVEKLRNPLSDELSIALHEMRLGKMRIEALRDMAKRTKVPELTSFVAAVYQADQLGVSIANVLRVQSQSLRALRTQRAREAASKLPIKLLFPLVFFIFPSLFIVTLGPGAIQTSIALGLGK